ncbi:MAG: uracil-DNA glycosylase [Clostridiales bacterium]|nr:uracil-DNA glycosylase [Clostridiales bacterium]
MVQLGNDWDSILAGEFEKEYYQELRTFLISEYKSKTIYPNMYDIFNALKHTAYHDVKAVILGQDPYHEPGQAHGLCFSVQKGIAKPPSLVNIFKELESDLGIKSPNHGFLLEWAEQGVLLLNTALTVRRGQANSHKGKGWELFTDQVITLLNERDKPLVFILWGANAKAKSVFLTNPNHKIITGAHPSPLSAHNGFWGGKYFSKTNDFLMLHGESPIDWEIKS